MASVKIIPSALTHENIRNSSNSIVIDVKDAENSEDEKSLDYSQFAPSSKETGDRSFIGSIGSMLESENTNSVASNKTVSKGKNYNKVFFFFFKICSSAIEVVVHRKYLFTI